VAHPAQKIVELWIENSSFQHDACSMADFPARVNVRPLLSK